MYWCFIIVVITDYGIVFYDLIEFYYSSKTHFGLE